MAGDIIIIIIIIIKYVVIEARVLFSQLYMLFWAFSKLSSGIRRVSSEVEEEQVLKLINGDLDPKEEINNKTKKRFFSFVNPEWFTLLCLHELILNGLSADKTLNSIELNHYLLFFCCFDTGLIIPVREIN